MKQELNPTFQKIYSIIFLCVFVSLSLLPILKSGITIDTINSDFKWRQSLINWFNLTRYKLNDRTFGFVVMGKNGWMFFLGDHTLGNYQQTIKWNKKELDGLVQGLEDLNNRLKSRGGTLLVVLAPDKSTIYPQFMPDEIPVIGKNSLYDQLLNRLESQSNVRVIDLRPDLIEASQTQQVYYKTDSHWNMYGGYVAFNRILQELSIDYPEITPRLISDFQVVPEKATRDIPVLLSMPNIQEEADNLILKDTSSVMREVKGLPGGQIVYATTPNTELPSILIYHDSFFGEISPWFEPSFSQCVSIWLPSGDPSLWHLGWVDQINPDIVIIEIVERNLDNIQMWPVRPAP